MSALLDAFHKRYLAVRIEDHHGYGPRSLVPPKVLAQAMTAR